MVTSPVTHVAPYEFSLMKALIVPKIAWLTSSRDHGCAGLSAKFTSMTSVRCSPKVLRAGADDTVCTLLLPPASASIVSRRIPCTRILAPVARCVGSSPAK